MKKILSTFILIIMMSTFIGCDNKGTSKEDYDKQVYDSYVQSPLDTRTGVCEGEDGWMYIIDIYRVEGNIFDYQIDAYNYKYDKIPNFGDELMLLYNPPSKSDIPEHYEEMNRLEAYLNSKQFTEPITVEDLDIELQYLVKEYVVEAFNNTLVDRSSMYMEENSHISSDYPAAYTDHRRLADGSRLSIGYCCISCTIKYVYIGVEYGDKTYLKDNVANNTATENEIYLYDIFKKIENKYVEVNSFDIKNELKDIDWNENDVLKNLSEMMDELKDMSWPDDWEV